MRRTTKPLWGVVLHLPGNKAFLGSMWHDVVRARPAYPGEPTRRLLFTNRNAARRGCQAQNAEASKRKDSMRRWRYQPVRVVETVRIAGRA